MRRLLLALAVLLLLAVVVQWPARELPALTGMDELGVRAERWNGTIWRGEVTGLSLRGVRLGTLTWQVSAASFLTLSPALRFELAGPELRAQGAVETSLTADRIEATDVMLEAPAAWLQHVLQQPFLQLGGRLVAELRAVRFGDGLLRGLEGTTRWTDATVRGNIEAALGDLVIQWSDTGSGAVGALTDTGGPLGANGMVTIDAESYRVDVALRAPAADVPLRQALELFGRPDASGTVRLAVSGPMVPLR